MFIEQYYINKKVCDDLVNFFKNSPNKNPGLVYKEGKHYVNKKCKNSIDLSFYPEKSRELEFVNYWKELSFCIKKYLKKWKEANEVDTFSIIEPVNIQYYPPGGGYPVYHFERGNVNTIRRHLVFMTYLNNVDDGGETEWKYQKLKIKPKKGLTVIWPVDWTFTHRGIISKTQDKYIITGWYTII